MPQGTSKPHRGRPKVAIPKKQYTLTMRPDMYERAKKEAERRGPSFSQLVSDALNEYLERSGVHSLG